MSWEMLASGSFRLASSRWDCSTEAPRPLGHVVEVLAHRLELVPAVVGDAVGEVAVPDLVDPLRQGLQGLLDVPEHEPGEEAVGDQHRRQDHHHRRGQEGWPPGAPSGGAGR